MSGVQLSAPYLPLGSAPLLTISRTAAAFPSRAAATSGGVSRGPAKQPARRTAQAGNASRILNQSRCWLIVCQVLGARKYVGPNRICPMQKITPFLWFNDNAEEAVNFYVSVFKNSKIGKVARYGKAGPGKEGTAMTIPFELAGQEFIALTAGPTFKFTEAISFVVN